jgi:hypothetical protein
MSCELKQLSGLSVSVVKSKSQTTNPRLIPHRNIENIDWFVKPRIPNRTAAKRRCVSLIIISQ